MFLEKRRLTTYQDFLNKNTKTAKPMKKPETPPKMQALLNEIVHSKDNPLRLTMTGFSIVLRFTIP